MSASRKYKLCGWEIHLSLLENACSSLVAREIKLFCRENGDGCCFFFSRKSKREQKQPIKIGYCFFIFWTVFTIIIFALIISMNFVITTINIITTLELSSVGLMGAILERKGGAEQENAADHISRQGNKMQNTKYKAMQANEIQGKASQWNAIQCKAIQVLIHCNAIHLEIHWNTSSFSSLHFSWSVHVLSSVYW